MNAMTGSGKRCRGDFIPARAVAISAVVIWLAGAATLASARGLDPEVALNRAWAERMFSGRAGSVPPFSFVYGGRPSGEFLGGWKRDLKEEQPDGTRTTRTLTFTDPKTALEVRAVATIYTDAPGADWTVYFTNRGTNDTPPIEQIRALDATDSTGDRDAAATVHRLNGSTCRADDWLPFDEQLAKGQTIDFTATGGRSSNVCPFFNVSWSTGGVITAIGWSGQWAASLQRDGNGFLRIRAGMERTHIALRPGESIRSPRIMQIRWAGSDQPVSYNLFRRTMISHILPRIDGRLVTPPVTTPSPWAIHDGDVWKYIYGFKEADALEEIKYLRGLSYEYYWTDAYFTRGNFPGGMGNYGLPLLEVVPDPVRFPRGLRPISDAAHDAGMKYIVWFEPERVVRGTTIAVRHPEYVIWREKNDSGLYNLGIPEAREYMTEVLTTAVKEWRMDCLRIDYNIDPLPYWQTADGEDPSRVGMCEIRYVEGLYRMWDDILKARPGLFIDNCASGGRRIDLETCSRAIPLWRTDGVIEPYIKFDYDQTALQNQVMNAGLNRYLPFSTSGSIGAKPYHFRSGFNYGVPIAERPREEERDLLRQAIEEGKRLRKYYLGDFYVLSPVTMSPADWCVYQYHRMKEQDGMIVAFRRQESPDGSFPCQGLRGIDPGAGYIVKQSRSYEPSEPDTLKGSALKLFRIRIDERPGSVIVEYRRTAAE